MRLRPAVVPAAVCAMLLMLVAGQARAAAEVHRLSLVISGMPTSIAGGDYNDFLDSYNKSVLDPIGYEPLQHVEFTWGFDAELRYFVRQNFAVSVGLTQIRGTEAKEFLPDINTSWDLLGELITVPVHVGGAYYLQPYNQGDFQARAFVGAGLMQYTHTRASFQQTLVTTDTTLSRLSTFRQVLTQDAPGYYFEAGGHMFFASRYSVIISAMYRSGVLRDTRLDYFGQGGSTLFGPNPGGVVTNSKGEPFKLDMSGVAVRFALAIGL